MGDKGKRDKDKGNRQKKAKQEKKLKGKQDKKQKETCSRVIKLGI